MDNDGQTIFILDWSGTLDCLPDPAYFLKKQLRPRFPEAMVVINSGHSSRVFGEEVLAVVDAHYMKRPETYILEYAIAEETRKDRGHIAARALRRVVLVDDEALWLGDSGENIRAYLERKNMVDVEVEVFTDVRVFRHWVGQFPVVG